MELDKYAHQLKASLEDGAALLSEGQKRDLAVALDLPASGAGTKPGDCDFAAIRCLLVIASAAMFHARLDDHLRDMRPAQNSHTGEPYEGPWPPMKLGRCLDSDEPVGRA